MASRTAAVKRKFKDSFPAIYIGQSRVLEISETVKLSGPFSPDTSIVRIISTDNCFIDIGLNPVASLSSMFVPKDTIQHYGIYAGHKISAIMESGKKAKLYITEAAS